MKARPRRGGVTQAPSLPGTAGGPGPVLEGTVHSSSERKRGLSPGTGNLEVPPKVHTHGAWRRLWCRDEGVLRATTDAPSSASARAAPPLVRE